MASLGEDAQTKEMVPVGTSASARFRSAILDAARDELGRDLPAGTVVVGSAARVGSTNTVAYPMGDLTLIWCAPEVAPRLASLDGQPALSNDEFVEAGTALGGKAAGWGRFRVVEDMPPVPDVDSARVRTLDRDDADDCAVITDFIAACPEEDRDEAELDIDDLDPAILAVLDCEGAAAALAFARPWNHDQDFDDIGIITRPDCRGQGLGAAAVALLVHQQQALGRLPLYNCDVENAGSDALADSLGFTLVQSVASVRFA